MQVRQSWLQRGAARIDRQAAALAAYQVRVHGPQRHVLQHAAACVSYMLQHIGLGLLQMQVNCLGGAAATCRLQGLAGWDLQGVIHTKARQEVIKM